MRNWAGGQHRRRSDGSPSSELALSWVVGQGRLSGPPVHAYIAWELPLAYGPDAFTALDRGGSSAAVPRAAVEMVLGEDGARLVDHQMTAHAHCPVVVVHAPTTSGGRTTVHESGP